MDLSKLTQPQLEKLFHMQGIIEEQKAEAARVLALRDYYDGKHPVLLTKRQQEIIGPLLAGNEFPHFADNHVKTVIDTKRARLNVTGLAIAGADEEDTSTPQAQVSAAMWEWWTKSRLDAEQIRLYRRAMRDGKAYIMVDFDGENSRPRFTLHHVDAGEQAPDIMLHRDPSDMNRVLYATRHFAEFDPLTPGVTGTKRKTVYLPDQIRKYVQGKAGMWEPTQDPGDTSWPIPWVDRNGKPLGIPIVEFANPGGSEVAQIIPLQNLLNKAWLDLITTADVSAFPLLVFEYDSTNLGAPQLNAESDADSEGSDESRISPGRKIEVTDARVHRIEAGDMSQIIAVIDRALRGISGAAHIPMYYLQPIGADIPSGESLKQMESALVADCEEKQLIFGNAWEDVFGLAYRINQAFGPSLPDLPELSVTVSWQDANVRNELVIAQYAEILQRLGVPEEEIWRTLDFTPEQIEKFKAGKLQEKQAQVAMVTAALRVDQSRQAANGNGAAVQRNGVGA